jgi:multimeric flavodoxin WrbA
MAKNMKLIIYDSTLEDESQIREFLDCQGEEVEWITDDGTIKNCIGCFGCWVKTPGRCVLPDHYNRMGEKLAHTDELIIISRCVYGTYAPFVRNVLDRCLPYIHPDFTTRGKEIHHKPRYSNRLQTSVYFYGECSKEEKETAVKTVKANLLNFNGILKHISFVKDRKGIGNESHVN